MELHIITVCDTGAIITFPAVGDVLAWLARQGNPSLLVIYEALSC